MRWVIPVSPLTAILGAFVGVTIMLAIWTAIIMVFAYAVLVISPVLIVYGLRKDRRERQQRASAALTPPPPFVRCEEERKRAETRARSVG